MKKIVLLSLLFFTGIFLTELWAQSFQTGKIGVEVNSYGRVRIHAPAIGNLRQIDRSSILIGVSPTQVYDYRKDADTEVSVHNIPNPQFSNFEIFVATNNAYSLQPPNFLVRISVYGWQNEPYILCKFTAVNRETSVLTPYIGIEFIPQTDAAYGFETVKFNKTQNIGYSFRGISPLVGYKIFSKPTVSFKVIDWTATYHDPDTLLWNYMTYNNFDTMFVAGSDGSVAILTQQPVTVAPNDSVHFWVGIAVGSDENDLFGNMRSAQSKYFNIVSVDDQFYPFSFELKQNYPNPFNPKTHIEFSIPEKQKVELTVFNTLGQKIKTILNEELDAGNHFAVFDGSELTSGIYFYKLKAGNYTSIKKMVLMK